jgi:hypothetical protein
MILELFQIGTKLLDKVLPDIEARDKAKAELAILMQRGELSELKSSMKVIVAETQGEGWLQRNWRPLTMVIFVALVVSRWLGFSAPNVTPELELKLFEIIQIGLGGYVVGRSGEKCIKAWKE